MINTSIITYFRGADELRVYRGLCIVTPESRDRANVGTRDLHMNKLPSPSASS